MGRKPSRTPSARPPAPASPRRPVLPKPEPPTPRWHFLACCVFLLAASGYLLLQGIGAAALWDDEAVTMIAARTLVETGHWSGWDGRNLLPYRDGVALRDDLTPVNAPLDILVGALAFRLFGISTGSSRVLFAVAGWLALLVLTRIAHEEFDDDESRLSRYFLGLACLSVPLILYLRTARYYSLTFLFSLLTYWCYRRYLATRRVVFLGGIAAATVLSFLANPMLCLTFTGALLIAHLAFYPRELGRRDWARVGAVVALVAVVLVSYAVFQRIWERPDHVPTAQGVGHRLTLIWWNLRDLSLWPALCLPALAVLLVAAVRDRLLSARLRLLASWATVALANAVLIGLLTPQKTDGPSPAELRYLIVSAPFLFGITAFALSALHRRSWLLAVGLFVAFSLCNVFYWTPANTRFRWTLPPYLAEIHHPYPTAYSEAVAYLTRNASREDRVYVLPDYMACPMQFYLGGRLRFCCVLTGLTRKTPLPIERIRQLDAPLLYRENFPDWIIAFGPDPALDASLQDFSRPHLEAGHTVRYEYRGVTWLPIHWDQTQRPEFHLHQFGPAPQIDPRWDSVFIFHRVAAGAAAPGGR